jgi:hypothetical protein
MGHEDTSAMENAVLSVLTGTPLAQAAKRVRTTPARLTDAIERYRTAGRAALATPPAEWHQVNIEFADYSTAELSFRACLLPYLRTGAVGAWWFVRKYPCWRLRVHRAPDADTEETIAHLTEILDRIQSQGMAKQ